MSSQPAEKQPDKPSVAIVPKSIGTEGFSILPRNFEELNSFCNMLAKSDFVPKDYRDKPGNVMVAIQMGAEVGLKALQAVQNIGVINGKPSIYGDLGKAILRAHGIDIEEADVEEIKKTGIARCKIIRQGQVVVERTFSVDDAKTAGLWGKQGPWTNYPHRQMAWRAFWFAARDAASDILKGLAGREELEDIVFEQGSPSVKVEDVAPKKKSDTKKAKEETIVTTVETIPVAAGTPPEEKETATAGSIKNDPILGDEDFDFEAANKEQKEPDRLATDAEQKDLLDAMKIKKLRAPDVIPEMKKRFGKNSPADLTQHEAAEMTTWVRQR